MAAFDFNLFNSLAGGVANPLGAIGTSFGLPSCLLQLGSAALSLLPSPILAAILGGIQAGMRLADGVVKAIFAKIRDWLGITEWDTEDGIFSFISKIFGAGGDSSIIAILALMGGIIGAAGALGQIYANIQATIAEIEAMIDCIKSYRDFLKLKNGFADEPMTPEAFQDYLDSSLAVEKAQLQSALAFIEAGNKQIDVIGSILADRAANPELEPKFTKEACVYFAGLGVQVNCEVEDPQDELDKKEIFRLIYGPPKSSAGQFILSQDGLYFDSQVSGITPVLTYLNRKRNAVPKEELWKFMHDPNLGGRGKQFSTKDLASYFNTILDPDRINESPYFQTYYDKDGFLQELIGNKNKRIYDLSSQIHDLETGNAPTSVIINFKQSLISENITLNKRINKRKKQIELAVALPQLYQTQVRYDPGEVPINDFSYLAGINLTVDIQKQKALSFSQADVSGVISPIRLQTNYIIPKIGNTRNSSLEHLIIPENGEGAIIYDGSSVSAVDAVILQTENSLTTDGLFAMYNFLDTDVEDPSSTLFNVRNSASETDELYAQLVAENTDSVFSRGLGIPFLRGITKHYNSSPTSLSGLGSFVKLPDSQKFNDFLYNYEGASIDFWAYVPDIFTSSGVGDVSSLYRLVLASENVGFIGDVSSTNTEYISNNLSNNVVRGFMMGFTRDRRIVSNQGASNNSGDNPVAQTSFFIAPTQSVTASSAGLINRSTYDGVDCFADTKYHAMKHPLSTDMKNVSGQFCHIAVTFNPDKDEVSFYFDGSKVTTSSLSNVFGIPKFTMPNLPTFKLTNSFEYSQTSVNADAPQSLKYGPKLDTYFTPWVIGGGYTDGLFNKGNFMGGTYGGIISGLRGYLGSIKFYSKPLDGSQILNNYNTHNSFFKNIDVSKL